jgi:hypothetical protein
MGDGSGTKAASGAMDPALFLLRSLKEPLA